MAKLKDVAEKAGVSISTASIVLNGKADRQRIAPATSRKILQVAGKLGYLKNVRSRTTKQRISDVIAIAFPIAETHTQTTDFWLNIVFGANNEATKKNQNTFIIPMQDNPEETIEHLIRYYHEGRIDAAILPGKIAHLFKAPPEFPIVFIGPTSARIAPHLKISFKHAYFEAIKHIIKKKRTKLLWIEQEQSTLSIERFNTLRDFAEMHNLKISKIELGVYNTETILKDEGLNKISDACEKHLTTISEHDVVFCYNDIIACGLLKAAQKNGYNIPSSFSIVGFDNLCSRFTSPRLATIDHKIVEMGAKAVNLIMRMTNSNNFNMDEWRTTTEHVDGELILGETL